LILYGLAGASGFFLQTLNGIIFGRVLLGLAVAGIMSGFTTLIGDYFNGKRLNQFMGYQAAVMGFGGVVFLLAGGLLADVGWHYPFLIYLFSFVVLIGVLYAVNEPDVETNSVQGASSEATADFPWRTVGLIYLIAFFSMILFYIVPVQLPFYLTAASDISGGQVGLAMAFQALAAAIVSLRFQSIRSRLSSWTITMLVFLTLGIGNVLIGLSTTYALVVLGLLISGIGLGFLIPNLNVWLVSTVPASIRGRAVGGLTTALFLGQFLSPFATQPIVQQIGLAGAFVVAGIVSLLIALVFVVAARSVAVKTAAAGS
jgi:MFS family permease